MSKFRLLHVVENLDKGAVENWLVHTFLESRTHRPDWQWTFYCVLGVQGRHDERVRAAGGEVIYARAPISDKVGFLRHFRSVVKGGQYDVIHMHHDFMNGFYLLALIGLKRPRIILQIHNNDEIIPVGSETLRKYLLPVFRRICLGFADDIVGISKFVLQHFIQDHIGNSPRQHVLYYGISMDRFAQVVDIDRERSELRIPNKCKLLLYIGRINKEKNPIFVLDVLQGLRQEGVDAYAVFVGEGELAGTLHERTAVLGLGDYVRILGWSDRIVALMKSADVFLFPRLTEPREGLGLVVVESQCAGLPMITTEGIVDDAIVIPELVTRSKLKVEDWINETTKVLSKGNAISAAQALNLMNDSLFNLPRATDCLISLYESEF